MDRSKRSCRQSGEGQEIGRERGGQSGRKGGGTGSQRRFGQVEGGDESRGKRERIREGR